MVAGGRLHAQTGTDTITLKTNPPQRKSGVVVTAVTGGRVMVREGAGEIGYNLDQIESVVKTAPPEFAQGMRFVEAGDAEKALPLLKGVADRFKGLRFSHLLPLHRRSARSAVPSVSPSHTSS